MASAPGSSPPRRSSINGEEFDSPGTTPEDLVNKIKEIVGDVPGLMTAGRPNPTPPPAPPTAP